MKRYGLFILTVCCAVVLILSEYSFSKQTVVLRADRMLDVVSGRIVTDAVVVIDGDRIISVYVSSVKPDSRCAQGNKHICSSCCKGKKGRSINGNITEIFR